MPNDIFNFSQLIYLQLTIWEESNIKNKIIKYTKTLNTM